MAVWGIELRHQDEISLARQIFLALREQILEDQITEGEALPSTRELAKGLGVSRNTVCEAYDMLMAEGFIVSHQGAPTRVAEGLQLAHRQALLNEVPPAVMKQEKQPVLWDFRTGQPDLSLFPWQLWSQMMREAGGNLTARHLGYSGPKGYEPLCEEIAGWLLRSRGMKVNPEDVFITAGATQALHLLVDVLYKDRRPFALENPSHPGIHTVIADKGYPMQWLPVDEQGAETAALEGRIISAVYVTPSHQFPLGGILPAGRRARLIRLALANDFYIIEDDYDSEFRYGGPPISPLYALDSSHVVYVGTFSKTLFPALRLGFAVLPKALQAKWRHCRHYLDVQNPVWEQAALAEFLRRRKLDKHVRHMRRIYGQRRNILLNAIESAFGKAVRPWGDASGLHVALQFPGLEFGKQFGQDCRQAGLRVYPLTEYCPAQSIHQDKLLMGYGHLNPVQIAEGIRVLQHYIQTGKNRKRTD